MIDVNGFIWLSEVLAASIANAPLTAVPIFTARCYAYAVLAMALCQSVTSRSYIKTDERIELVFGV